MPTYYVDPAAGGNDDGTDWTNAWTTLQRAIDGTNGTQPAAGDIVYCRGTETLSASVDVDGNEGSDSVGFIRYIGCNGSGNVDGTRFVLDANSAAVNCLQVAAGIDYHCFENFEFKNATSGGVIGASWNYRWAFINCSFNNNGARGLDNNTFRSTFYILCTAYSNTTDGFFMGFDNYMIFCSAHDNTGSGAFCNGNNQVIIGCLIYDNGDDGLEGLDEISLAMHNVIDGNADDGLQLRSGAGLIGIIGNRITNHSGSGDNGMDFVGEITFHGWNYLEDNDTHYANTSLALELLDSGVGTNDEDNADTNEGYTSKADGSEDFNLRSDASLRRTAISIPIT